MAKYCRATVATRMENVLLWQQLDDCFEIVEDSFKNGNVLASFAQQFFDRATVYLFTMLLPHF